MDEQVQRLAQKILLEAERKPKGERLLVAIAGPPGSGKSTFVEPLMDLVNAGLKAGHGQAGDEQGDEHTQATTPEAICVSLDGWHHYRHELDLFPDPKEAHWRRGAAFTFDMAKYLAFVKALRDPSSPATPFFLFDHALKDPSPAPTPVLPHHRVVVIEGLYTLLDRDGWREAVQMMDVKVWIEVDRQVARRRLVERNFAAGLCGTREETERRVDQSDMANGEEVREFRVEPTDVVVSVDLPSPR